MREVVHSYEKACKERCVGEYDIVIIVIIVIIYWYSYQDIEPNEGIEKLIATVWGKKGNTSRETS